jgi:hypothetical protein
LITNKSITRPYNTAKTTFIPFVCSFVNTHLTPYRINGYGGKVGGKLICNTPRNPTRTSPQFENYGGKTANTAKIVTSQLMAFLAVLVVGFSNEVFRYCLDCVHCCSLWLC